MKVNVIMSVYNESLEFIDQSIESVLKQTYKDFSLIVVNDNPSRSELEDHLKKWEIKDSRIHVLKNEVNIGLALSMNKAASYSESDYLIRMDADDICYPNRFEKIIKTIVDNDYDLVCSSFDYINENGDLIGKYTKKYSDYQLEEFLKYDNVIHHPTTIFKTSKFNEVGQYNDFPCAQDYDLWNRFVNHDARIHMIDEPLLKYRIQSNSTTSKKRFLQSIVMDYVRKMNKDNIDFDKNSFNLYYQENKSKYENKFQLYNSKYEYFLKNKKGFMSFVKSLLLSSYIRKKFFFLIKYKLFQRSISK